MFEIIFTHVGNKTIYYESMIKLHYVTIQFLTNGKYVQ